MYRDLGTRYGLGFELSLVRNQVKTVKRLKAALDSGDEAGIGRLSKKLRGLLFQSESMLPEHEVEVLSKVDLLRKLTLPNPKTRRRTNENDEHHNQTILSYFLWGFHRLSFPCKINREVLVPPRS